MNGLIGRTIGHYTILKQIGQGGMSSVFQAVDTLTNRPVAIKILSPYLANDASFQARFEREVRLLQQLKHPHIIPILDHGEAEGLTYIAMPFVASGTLHDRLIKGPLDPITGGKIVGQLASALAYAHDQGIIHRDIKPSNVLLDEKGNALLSDFSFARPQETSQNLTGSALIGTPAYMSPEQCRGEPITVRSDQYSFAVMLFQIATGQLPFEGETPMAVAIKHVNTPLPRPREVNPNLPEGVERVLIRALAKDPALRFDSVQELNEAFQIELKAALDPRSRTADARTIPLDRTQELYRRYQNVKPLPKKTSSSRPTVVATILLLLACAVSAGAVGIIYPQMFGPARAAPATAPIDVQATVEALLTARAPAEGTQVSIGELETAVYAAVLETLRPTLTSQAGASGSESQTDVPATAFLLPVEGTPSLTASPSSTVASTLGTRTPTRTSVPPSPTLTSAPPTATTAGSTSAPPSPSPTQTVGPTNTSPPPTDTATPTSAPPTDTLPPPTNTLPPPTATSPAPACKWDVSGVDIHGDEVSVVIHNTGDLELHITGVGISWTNDHEHLVRVRIGSSTIWSGWDDAPDFYVGTSKNVSPGGARTLEFEFWGSHFDGSASVSVDGGC